MRQASREQDSIARLAANLRERREEIEAATMTRVFAVSELPLAGGTAYAQGLRRAATVAIEYGIASIERSEAAAPSPPPILLDQAELAARLNVGLDTVLRRYIAGHAILGDFVVEEDRGQLPPEVLKRLLRRLAAAVDRLLVAVTDSYSRGRERSPSGSERRRAEVVERLLAGEPIDPTELGYTLEGWHVGLVARGTAAAGAVSGLARSLGARLLALPAAGDVLWAWLGWRDAPDPDEVGRVAIGTWVPGQSLAIGEPGEGSGGWRLTHRQAAAALPVALQRGEPVVAYRDVALVAAAMQDDLLATSLRRLYVDPLERERDGGATLVETLREYFAAERNISSTAAALGLTRKTVTRRIQAVEQCVGRSLAECDGELRLALQVNRWGHDVP